MECTLKKKKNIAWNKGSSLKIANRFSANKEWNETSKIIRLCGK